MTRRLVTVEQPLELDQVESSCAFSQHTPALLAIVPPKSSQHAQHTRVLLAVVPPKSSQHTLHTRVLLAIVPPKELSTYSNFVRYCSTERALKIVEFY